MTSQVLQDRTKTGRTRPWAVHKTMNGLLAIAYDEVDERKALRLRDCATHLSFLPTDGGMRLKEANFCRVRLCPMCTWRRSLKVAGQMRRVMDAIKADKPRAYIMLTLTMKNCQPEMLGESIDNLLLSFARLTKLKEYKGVSHGYYRAVEVTHNISEDTYHPHIHAVFCVNPSYFTSRDYIKQERWTELWQQCLRANYTPVVHVQKIKGDTAKAVAEVAKYAMKVSDYILPDDWDMTIDTVRLLDRVLANRRFVGFGGIFKEYHKRLHLDDAEDGDLVHVDGDDPDEKGWDKLIHFAWFSGYRQYGRVE